MSRNFDVLTNARRARKLFETRPILAKEPEPSSPYPFAAVAPQEDSGESDRVDTQSQQCSPASLQLEASPATFGADSDTGAVLTIPSGSFYNPRGPTTEIASIVQRLFFAGQYHSVVICSPDYDHDTAFLAVQVADCLSQNVRSSVCLVEDAGEDNRLTSALDASDQKSPQLRAVNLFLLRAQHPTAQQERHSRIRSAQNRFDYVIVSAPPLAGSFGTAMLATDTDGLVLAIRAGTTSKTALFRARDVIRSSGVTLLGSVLYNRAYPIPDQIYCYL